MAYSYPLVSVIDELGFEKRCSTREIVCIAGTGSFQPTGGLLRSCPACRNGEIRRCIEGSPEYPLRFLVFPTTPFFRFLERNFLGDSTTIRPDLMSRLHQKTYFSDEHWRELHRFFFRNADKFTDQ